MIVVIMACIVHLLCSFRGQLLIYQCTVLTKNQKIINSLLLWLIPFLWFWVVRLIVQPTEGSIGKRGRDAGGNGGETVMGSDMG